MTIDRIDTMLDGSQEDTQSTDPTQNQGIDQIDTGMAGIHPVNPSYEQVKDGLTVNDETPVGFFVDQMGRAYVKRGGSPMVDDNEMDMIEARVDLAQTYDGDSIIGEITTDRESGDNQYSHTELESALRSSDVDTRYLANGGEGSFHYDAAPQDGDLI